MSQALQNSPPARCVAGVGFRAGATADDVCAVVDAALANNRLARPALLAVATLARKRGSAALQDAASRLGAPIVFLDDAAALAATPADTPLDTPAARALGVPSVAEACALAAAGPGARLAGPRVVHANATCAIALCATASLALPDESSP